MTTMKTEASSGSRSSPLGFVAVILALLVMLVCQLSVQAASGQAPEKLNVKNYVSDFANVLGAAVLQQLNALCGGVDQKTQAQIAVVTVKTLDGKAIEDYSMDLATRLGVGPK